MRRAIVKVQLPIGGNTQAVLVYDEERTFLAMVEEGKRFRSISKAQDQNPKAFWHADIDDEQQTFKLVGRAPDQNW